MRSTPIICLLIALLQLLSAKLRFRKQYIGKSVKLDDGQSFKIFRHIARQPLNESSENIVFIVRFKFARLSHKANKKASIIPMLIIAGFPGFMEKIYAVNPDSGYWQGMYQWKSAKHLEAYKKSFIYKMMNKRAIKGSIESVEFSNKSLDILINENN